jgi:hypothetical protein
VDAIAEHHADGRIRRTVRIVLRAGVACGAIHQLASRVCLDGHATERWHDVTARQQGPIGRPPTSDDEAELACVDPDDRVVEDHVEAEAERWEEEEEKDDQRGAHGRRRYSSPALVRNGRDEC